MALDAPDSFPPQPLDDGETDWDIDSSWFYVGTGVGMAMGIAESHEAYCASVHYDTYHWPTEEAKDEC